MHPQTLEGVWALDPKSRTGPFPWGVLRLSPLRALVRMMPARRPEVAGLDPQHRTGSGARAAQRLHFCAAEPKCEAAEEGEHQGGEKARL